MTTETGKTIWYGGGIEKKLLLHMMKHSNYRRTGYHKLPKHLREMYDELEKEESQK